MEIKLIGACAVPDDASAMYNPTKRLLDRTGYPDCHNLAFLLRTISDVDIIREDTLDGPFSDLVLVDANLDGLASGVLTRAQRQV